MEVEELKYIILEVLHQYLINPFCFSMTKFMVNSIINEKTVGLNNIDIGNLAPLASS